jgi:hypothetical protein
MVTLALAGLHGMYCAPMGFTGLPLFAVGIVAIWALSGFAGDWWRHA